MVRLQDTRVTAGWVGVKGSTNVGTAMARDNKKPFASFIEVVTAVKKAVAQCEVGSLSAKGTGSLVRERSREDVNNGRDLWIHALLGA